MGYTSKIARRPGPLTRGVGAMGDIWDELDTLVKGAGRPSDAAPGDNVNQTAGGGTTTSVADFKSVRGVCKPMNFPALEAVREFQRQMNRVAQVKGFSKTSVDGAVGPGTLALFRLVQAAAAGSVMGDPSSCMGVAPDVDVLAAQIRSFADGIGAPVTVSGPISIAPATIVTKSDKVIAAPDSGLATSLATLGSVERLALLGVAGGIGYLLLTKPKKRRR